jgi:hypothetical protein
MFLITLDSPLLPSSLSRSISLSPVSAFSMISLHRLQIITHKLIFFCHLKHKYWCKFVTGKNENIHVLTPFLFTIFISWVGANRLSFCKLCFNFTCHNLKGPPKHFTTQTLLNKIKV